MARPAISFTGVDEVNRVLDALPARVGPRFVRGILRKNARTLVVAAKRLSSDADVTGETTRSIGTLAARVGSGGGIAVLVGPRRGNGFKGQTAHLQEYGTKAHTITPKRKKYLSFRGRYVRSVSHPGTAAQPFMRPAVAQTLGQVLEGIKADLRLALDGYEVAGTDTEVRVLDATDLYEEQAELFHRTLDVRVVVPAPEPA